MAQNKSEDTKVVKSRTRQPEIKVAMPPEVLDTMRKLSEISGLSQRRLVRYAMDHMIRIFAKHYGLQDYAVFGEKMPPERLTSGHVEHMRQLQEEQQRQAQVQADKLLTQTEPQEPVVRPFTVRQPQPYTSPEPPLPAWFNQSARGMPTEPLHPATQNDYPVDVADFRW